MKRAALILGLLFLSWTSHSQDNTFRLYGEINNPPEHHTFMYVYQYVADEDDWIFYVSSSHNTIHQVWLPVNQDYRIVYVNGDITRDVYINAQVKGEYKIHMDFIEDDFGLIYYDPEIKMYLGVVGSEDEVFGPDN